MRRLQLLSAVCVFSTALIAANNPFVGTWKLNIAKSKFAPGTAPKEAMVTFEAVGDQVKRTLTEIDSDGEHLNQSGTIPWDGMDHKIDVPNGPAITVAVKKVNDRTINVTVKREGRVVETIHSEVSADGKTLTAAVKGEDPKGRKIDNVEVLEKE